MVKNLSFFLLLIPLFVATGCNNNNPLSTPLFIECVEGKTDIQYYWYAEDVSAPNLEYSYNLKQWYPIEVRKEGDSPIRIAGLDKGRKMYFRGNNPGGFNHYNLDENPSKFIFNFTDSNNLKLKIGGNIMSLLSIDEYSSAKDVLSNGCFISLFQEFGGSNNYMDTMGSVDASGLLLPATDLKDYAYCYMFCNASLTKAPSSLPAEVAKKGVYEQMFEGNPQLVNAPLINLKNLEESSCSQMFSWCSKLDVSKDRGKNRFFTCPKLNGENCVHDMFSNTKTSGISDPKEGEVFYYS